MEFETGAKPDPSALGAIVAGRERKSARSGGSVCDIGARAVGAAVDVGVGAEPRGVSWRLGLSATNSDRRLGDGGSASGGRARGEANASLK